MGRRSTGEKPKKRKRVTVQLIPPKHAGETPEPYRLLEEIRAVEHNHLADAKIGMAWRMGWRADADGHLRLGQCRKRGDLDRELDGFDFIIMLNREAWPTLNDKQKRALIDHELCHAQLSMDADGNPKRNDRDRLVCRLRKHDTEEFRAVVNRHGLWTADLEAIARAAINDAKRPLLAVAEAACQDNGGGDNGGGDNGKGSTPASPNAWRRQKIAVLPGLAPKTIDLLAEAGLTTLGRLSDYMGKYGTTWANGLKGIGEVAATKIEDAWARFWADHPEFCQPEDEEADDAKEGGEAEEVEDAEEAVAT